MPYYIEGFVVLGFYPWRVCAVYSFKKSMVQLSEDWLLGWHNKYTQMNIFFRRINSIIKGLKGDVVRIIFVLPKRKQMC